MTEISTMSSHLVPLKESIKRQELLNQVHTHVVYYCSLILCNY